MTLDVALIGARIRDLVRTVDPDHDAGRFNALRQAWEALDGLEVNRRLGNADRSVLLHALTYAHAYRTQTPLPPTPTDYRIGATDGSSVLPSRHSPARYYLVNIGFADITYGANPTAAMATDADLRFDESDLWIDTARGRMPVNDAILGMRRSVQETQALHDLLTTNPHPTSLGLVDGTLILWPLVGQDPAVEAEVLPGFFAALDALRAARIPVAGYTSAPGAPNLLNTLKVSVCDYPAQGQPVNCGDCRARWHTERRRPACDVLPMVTDRFLLEQIAELPVGARTSVFDSNSSILNKYPEEQQVLFYYVNTGREIGRVEIPRWVSDDAELLDRTHALIFDQCQRGRGYPVVLQEAHEQAVINMADRRLIELLVERELAQIGVVLTWTGKDGSKRGRFV